MHIWYMRSMSYGRTHRMDDVQRHGDLFLVKLQQTKTKVPGSFIINGRFSAIVQKYIDLRPTQVATKDRFFVNYQRGKCTVELIGKNKFSQMPRQIAEYLGLAKVERYTGTINMDTMSWLHITLYYKSRFSTHVSKQRRWFGNYESAASELANLSQSNNNSTLTQSHTNSTLNAVLGRSFKSVNFERMDRCTINVYLKHKKKMNKWLKMNNDFHFFMESNSFSTKHHRVCTALRDDIGEYFLDFTVGKVLLH